MNYSITRSVNNQLLKQQKGKRDISLSLNYKRLTTCKLIYFKFKTKIIAAEVHFKKKNSLNA